jgi:hypothetical protein
MWKKLYDIAQLVFNLGEDLRESRENIKQLQAEVRELTGAVQRLAYEIQRVRRTSTSERSWPCASSCMRSVSALRSR